MTENNTPVIGVVVSPDISIEGSSGAEEHLLYDIGRMLEDSFRIEVVGGNELSERTERKFDNYNYLGVRLFRFTPLNALMLPVKILNAVVYTAQRDPDVLFHIGGTGTNGLAVFIAGRVFDIPTVTRNTGDTFSVHRHQSGWWPSLKTWVKSTLLSRITMSGADRIITLGEHLKATLSEHGIDEGKIRIIPQPLDLSSFKPPEDKRSTKRACSLPASKPVALSVLRLETEKGADRLLGIAERVLERDDDIVFCVIGRGEYQSDFESLARHDRVIYHEHVPHEEIPMYYRAADVFVLPSRIEGVPNVVLESLACGVPVLATPVGEVPHILDTTCNTEDEFIERLLDREFPEQEFPERYTWDTLQKGYRDLFFECVNHG